MKYYAFLIALLLSFGCNNAKDNRFDQTLLYDDFSGLNLGSFSANVGAHAEYHYLPEAGKKGNWAVSSYESGSDWGTAWQVKKEGAQQVMCQTFRNTKKSKPKRMTHPMIIAGDSIWRNYKLTVRFRPEDDSEYAGIAFRYKNDRCFYFLGIKKSVAYISMFKNADSYNTLNEKILAEQPFHFDPDQDITATVTVVGNSILAKLNDDISLNATDDTYPNGKIGLVSNAKAQYKSVEVLVSADEMKYLENTANAYQQEMTRLQEKNPKMVLWKKIKTEGFGVGRNLRFGDLNNDGQVDVLVGQVVHHDWPRNTHTELSCLTAMTFDGDILWRTGKPDPEKNQLSNDVGFQIHDLDNDGKNEVVYCMNCEIIVADAATGNVKYKAPTPKSKVEGDTFSQILGDCLFFFDAEGKGYDSNILIKDRYWNFWVMNSKLKVIWEGSCNTGHYPYAYDIDHDGKDELAIGYSLYDNNGMQLWNLDNQINIHADGVAIVDFDENPETEPVIMWAASDEGYLRLDLKGNIIEHEFIGHVQNPVVANFRSDIPGLETVTINFWGNQGIVHYFDSDGNIYHDFEPNQFGSMCLPLNWDGNGEEYFVHNANVREGGVFNGWGRKVLVFPDDGHPDMCNATLDITGDCRDEIVVWNPNEIWVYTQSDNPKTGKLYKPVRNPLYNYSNYQATVSLPGWNKN